MLKNVTRCHLLSFLEFRNRTVAVAKSKLTTLTLNSAEVFSEARTRVVVMVIFSAVKACSYSSLQVHAVLLLVTLKKEQAISKKLWINL